MVVLNMARFLWSELRKVQVEAESYYRLYTPDFMMGQYLWESLQDYRVMDELTSNQLHKHLQVAPHITLYLFENRYP